MGVLISRFRKKKSTIEILEGIEKDITNLQKFRRQNQELQKKFIGSLLLYSILLYVASAVIFYFYYFPNKWRDCLLYSTPLLLFPVLIWFIKKFLHWYFVKRITKNDLALNELREKKKKILEDVMENETYKKAKEILEKFDPARFKQLETPAAPTTPKISPPESELRRRPVTSVVRTPAPLQRGATPQVRPGTPGVRHGTPGVRPGTTPNVPRSAGIQPRILATPQSNGLYGRTPGPPLPRPVPPRERSTTDRLLEYLVGDGPQNRYALICKMCHSHNGMALKEEFEYLSFRCCYCFHMNQAKKSRPYAPKLEIPQNAAPSNQPEKKTIQQGIKKDDENSNSSDDENGDEDDNNNDDDDDDDGDGDVDDGNGEKTDHGGSGPESDIQTTQGATGNIQTDTTTGDLSKDIPYMDESQPPPVEDLPPEKNELTSTSDVKQDTH